MLWRKNKFGAHNKRRVGHTLFKRVVRIRLTEVRFLTQLTFQVLLQQVGIHTLKLSVIFSDINFLLDYYCP